MNAVTDDLAAARARRDHDQAEKDFAADVALIDALAVLDPEAHADIMQRFRFAIAAAKRRAAEVQR